MTTPEEEKKKTFNQIMELRRLTQLTGEIQPLQQLQLNTWPIIACPHSSKHEVHCDLVNKAILFKLTVPKKKRPPGDYQVRLDKLSDSVQMLLGPDWSISIQENNKKVRILHEGQKLPPDPVVGAVTEYSTKPFGAEVRKRTKDGGGPRKAKRKRAPGV